MTIVHHPDVTTIMTCSAGSQPEALCAVVTSHLSMCPECMRELRALEEIGVGLFECSQRGEKVSMASMPTTDDVIDQLRDPDVEFGRGDVPWPLVPVLGHSLDALEWTDVQPGISTVSIALSPKARGDLRLLKLAQGARLPEHGHIGEELSLVLRGSYSDEFGTFAVGDMADLDDDRRHCVLAGQQGCIILIASETDPAFLLELAENDA